MESSALIVLPRSSQGAARIPCLAGPRGTGKTSLAVAVADELGRRHVRVTLDKRDTAALIRARLASAPRRLAGSAFSAHPPAPGACVAALRFAAFCGASS